MKNKKLIATVASLCLVLVAVVAAVVGVLAASQQKVQNNISIKYEARDVNATIVAEAKQEGEDNFTDLLDGAEGSSTFAKSETQTRTLAAEAYTAPLNSNSKYVLYHMSFTNLNTAHGMSITGTYKHYGTQPTNGVLRQDKNVSAWYKWSATALTGESEPAVSYSDDIVVALATQGAGAWTAINTVSTAGADQNISANVDKKQNESTGNTIHLYILVAITDINEDALYLLGTSSETVSSTTTLYYGNFLEFVLERYDA